MSVHCGLCLYYVHVYNSAHSVTTFGHTFQDLKNAKSGLKKTSKALEKEREKLAELEAAPDHHKKEIADAEKKIKILEVSNGASPPSVYMYMMYIHDLEYITVVMEGLYMLVFVLTTFPLVGFTFNM